MEEWRRRVIEAKGRADHMTPAGLFVEVARLIGLLNDAHSWAAVDDDSRLFSRAVLLRFWKFEDGLYIRAAAPEFSD